MPCVGTAGGLYMLVGRAELTLILRQLFAMLQQPRLMRHLAISILDALLQALFPELAGELRYDESDDEAAVPGDRS